MLPPHFGSEAKILEFRHIEAAGILQNHLIGFPSFRLQTFLNGRGLGDFKLPARCALCAMKC